MHSDFFPTVRSHFPLTLVVQTNRGGERSRPRVFVRDSNTRRPHARKGLSRASANRLGIEPAKVATNLTSRAVSCRAKLTMRHRRYPVIRAAHPPFQPSPCPLRVDVHSIPDEHFRNVRRNEFNRIFDLLSSIFTHDKPLITCYIYTLLHLHYIFDKPLIDRRSL